MPFAASAPASPAQPPSVLAQAPSPYLRAHASDLVRWRPWGKAAFAEAKRNQRLIFLSVGYLACYWCSVMKRESFMDAEVATLLNAHFVPILVDREAQPDIDALYLEITRLVQGVAGWPNNLVLLPDGRPVMAFGYVPKQELLRRLEQVRDAWRSDPQRLRARAARLAARIRQHLQHGAATAAITLPQEAFVQAVRQLAERYDPFFGGLDAVPKHFRVPQLRLLARAALVHRHRQAREALHTTLRSIVHAAVFDPLTGGFFRYATDAAWEVPHFEKMLADQAQLADVLRKGWRIFGAEWMKQAALATLRFAIDELSVQGGGFASSLSAVGADGSEGSYYLWTWQELQGLLDADQLKLARRLFVELADGALAGFVLPRRSADLSPQERRVLEDVLAALKQARARRPRPLRDDKVVAADNGLMIAALARAGAQWRLRCLVQRAEEAARFVLANLRDEGRGLARYWHAGRAHGRATLADYAHLIEGLLALHDAQPAAGWLDKAETLALEAEQRLYDAASRRWWFAQGASGFMRLPPPPDGAMPDAAMALARALMHLHAAGGDARWRRHAKALIAARLPAALRDVAAHPSALHVADIWLRGADDLVIHGAGGQLAVRARWAAGGAQGGRRALAITLRLRPGWHVQSHAPADANLIATQLRLLQPPQGKLSGVRYPPPHKAQLAFAQAPLDVFKGLVRITARYAGPLHEPVILQLQAQACSDTICLAPEWLRLYLPAATPP